MTKIGKKIMRRKKVKVLFTKQYGKIESTKNDQFSFGNWKELTILGNNN